MNLLTQNSKLKKTSKELGKRVFNFGIPAYKTASGKLTCPMADECVKFCYAKKGAYIWSNVKPAFERRYEITKQDDFVDVMTAEIRKKKAEYVRIHDSGDFYSRKYLHKWIEVMKQRGLTLLLVEQNVRYGLDCADRGYVMERGRIVLEGSKDTLKANPEIKKAYLGVQDF